MNLSEKLTMTVYFDYNLFNEMLKSVRATRELCQIEPRNFDFILFSENNNRRHA